MQVFRAALKGTNLRGQIPICGLLRVAAGSCENLRFSAKSCTSLMCPQRGKTYILNSRCLKGVSVSWGRNNSNRFGIVSVSLGAATWRDIRACTNQELIWTQLTSVSVSVSLGEIG